MNSIDIRTGEAGKIDTIIFADEGGGWGGEKVNAIQFKDEGEMDIFCTDDPDCVVTTLDTSDAYNMYHALGKAIELGLIPTPKLPAVKRVATPKKA